MAIIIKGNNTGIAVDGNLAIGKLEFIPGVGVKSVCDVKEMTEDAPFEEIVVTGNGQKVSPSDPCAFDRDLIKLFVTDSHKDEVADILIDLMMPYKDKRKPKEGLLPFYCAIYEVNWLRRPEYDEFNRAFAGIAENKSSYSQYVPTVRTQSKYRNAKEISVDSMAETLQTRLNEKINTSKK